MRCYKQELKDKFTFFQLLFSSMWSLLIGWKVVDLSRGVNCKLQMCGEAKASLSDGVSGGFCPDDAHGVK